MFSTRKSNHHRSLFASTLLAGGVFLCLTGNALADLTITKTIDPITSTPAVNGGFVSYDLVVTNTGVASVSNVVIEDFPVNMNAVNFNVTGTPSSSHSAGPGTNQYTFNNLAAGETVTLDVNTNVNAVAVCPIINNSATVTGGAFSNTASAPPIEYDFEFTSGSSSNVISHITASSYCEFCNTGEVRIRITNPLISPTTAAMTNIVLQEDLQALGLTYIGGSTTFSVNGAAFVAGTDPAIIGTNLTWDSIQIGALANLVAGDFIEVNFRVSTYTEAMMPPTAPNRNIKASATFGMACIAASQTVDTGDFELPIRQAEPQVIKVGRNFDADQTIYDDPVYGNQNDDVIWRVNVQNTGLANMEALLINDSITGNFSINFICPTEASANATAASNGVTGGSGCIAMTTPFDVDDPFGNATNPDDISAGSNNGFIYYVGRILTSHTNEINNADVSWGCEATSAAGGSITVPASNGGSTPSVTLSDTGDLSAEVVPAGLQISQTVTGSNTSQPLGAKGLMTIFLNNQTGGSIKNITVDATLPAGYVMDNTYGVVNGVGIGQPTSSRTGAYGSNYDGFIDEFVRDDPELITADPLDDNHPTFTFTSATAGEDPEQDDMMRHGDRVSITFGIIMIDPARFDKEVDLDLAEEIIADGTDPTNAFLGASALSNTVIVDFDSVDPAGLQTQTRNENFSIEPNPEDLDINISDSLFILTNDVGVPLNLNVLLTNNGGHDADDHTTYVSFGQAMTVQTPAPDCSLTSNPPPHPHWNQPSTIPATATVYACDRGVIAPGDTETFTFSVIKNISTLPVPEDDLTFRADVVGEITRFDSSLLIDPAPAIVPNTTPNLQLANNYTLDGIRSRVLGFNLTKSVWYCTESGGVEPEPSVSPVLPPATPADLDTYIGEDCNYHLESGGWFGFVTPGYSLIAVEDVVVTDDLPDGQGFIHFDNTKAFNFDNTANVSFVGVDGGAGTTPLDETDVSWQFNAAGAGITVKDEFFRVDLKTRFLNDPVDSSALPNLHATQIRNIARTSFNALFQSDPIAGVVQLPLNIPVSELLGIPGYPLEITRRVDMTVTEPSVTITKEVCNETLNGSGTACSVFSTSINDGDTNDSYIYKITLANEASSAGTTRAPAFNIISTDTLDSTDLMLIANFSTDGLDNDGDGLIDALDVDGEGAINDNVISNATPAVITFDSTHSAPLLRVNPGSSVTFYYRVDPDDAISPLQTMTNTVSMSYDTLAGDFGNQNLPQLNNASTSPNDVGRARIYTTTTEQANVQMIALIAQPIVITALSNSALGGSPQAVVPGEEIRYQLTAELPVANLRNFKIRNELPAGIRCIEQPPVNLTTDAAYVGAGFDPGGLPVSTTCTNTGTNDVVEWDFGDQELTTGLTTRFDFVIDYVARVENTAVTNNGVVITNGGGTVNPATCTGGVGVCYQDQSGVDVALEFAPVNVVVREPVIALTKSFAVANSDAGDVLTVTVTATNNGTAAAYNLRVLDDLLASDLTYIAGSVSGTDPPDNVDIVTFGANQPVFSWNSTNPDYEILPAEVKTFTFNVRVDTTAQPLEILDNTIQAEWSSLPDLNTALNSTGSIAADGSALGLRNGVLPNAGDAINDYETTVVASTTVLPLIMTKTNLTASIVPAVVPTIGEHENFEIVINLPEGTTNNLIITDDLNASGQSYALARNATFDISYTFNNIISINGVAPAESAFTGTGLVTLPVDNATGLIEWNIGTVITDEENDTSVNAKNPSITINYRARINNVLTINAGVNLSNSATVNYSNGEVPATTEVLSANTAPVTVVEPDIDILDVSKIFVANLTNPGVAPDRNDILQYQITVTNNGGVTAFDVNVTDILPAELILDVSVAPTALINGVAATGFVAIPAGSPVGPLIWGRGNIDNSLDIPAGQSLVLTYQTIVQTLLPTTVNLTNTIYIDWTSLDGDSIYERTGLGCLAITAPNDYCVGPVNSQVAVVEPELTLEKRGPAGSVQFGVGAPYTLVLENIGSGAAFGVLAIDKLPNVADNPPLLGGTCDVSPANFDVRITSVADEATVLRALTVGTDYTVTHTAAPTCELVIETLSVASGIANSEKLLISYNAFVDSGTESGALLTNIAGVTRWFSQDISAGSTGVQQFNRTITDGTTSVVDHQDAFTVTAEAPTVEVQKTVVNVTTGDDPGVNASPGDVLRYSIVVSVPAASPLDANNVIITDAIPANATYVADSVTLNGLPVGQPDAGVSPLIAGVEVGSSSLTPPLPVAGAGVVLIGESATLTFDVILDAVIDSGTVISNQATATIPGSASVLSDDPLVAGGSDPTNTLITSAPIFQVQKTSQDISGDAALLLAGDTLRYTITVKNIGNENAINMSLSDVVPANTSYVANTTNLNGVLVTDPTAGISALAAGLMINAPENTTAGVMRADINVTANNVATITFDVLVNPAAVIGTVISNQGFINGAGAGSGVIPQQPSDDPGTAIVNDPTIDIVGNIPLFDVQKTVAIVVDGTTAGIVDPGDTLRYTITATNLGEIPITNVVLTDAVPVNTTYVANTVLLNGLPVAQPDAGISPLIVGVDISSSDLTPALPLTGAGILSPGETATITFDVVVNAGTPVGTVISNQGFVSNNELPVEPTDSDGIDANGDQPTTVTVGSAPLISITKQVLVVGGGTALAGSELEYIVRVTNTGIVPVTNVIITDDLDLPIAGQMTYVAGSGLINGLPAGVSFAGSILTADYSTTYGNLIAKGVVELRFRVLLDAGLNIGDNVSNMADVSWNIPPTIASATVDINIGGTPGSVNLTGEVWTDTDFSNDIGVGETLLQDWRVELYQNNVLLANALTDANGIFNFSGLPPNNSGGVAYEIRYSAPGTIATTASLGTTNSAFTNGPQRISDIFAASGNILLGMNLPLQANGVVYDSVLRSSVAGVQLTMINQSNSNLTVPDNCFDDSKQQNQITLADGFYKFDLNFSDPVNCSQAHEYVIQVSPPAATYVGATSVIIPPVEAITGVAKNVPGCLSDGSDKIPATTLHCENSDSAAPAPASVAPRTLATEYYLKFIFDNVPSTNQIYNNHIPVDPKLDSALAISKVAGIQNVTRSQLVPYTITFNNTLGVNLFDLSIIDNYPAGFKYVTGSSRVDGAEIEPTINGRTLTWANLTADANQSRVIKLLLVVSSGVGEGEYINTANAINALTGEAASGVASATVRVIPDTTFDCTDIIGKVYDDKNNNAYQDEGEVGLAGVQVVTARGLRVTTDENGRFHVTCAVVPNEIRGSNFIMKLDDRTLPSGYRITTENPRVQRATRGKMMKFNFGAAIHRVVRLDLADGVFEKDTNDLRPQWRSRIDLLMTELQKDPSVLRLAYLGENEIESKVDDRLEAVEDLIAERWEALDCCYKLTIETEVFWRKGNPSNRMRFKE